MQNQSSEFFCTFPNHLYGLAVCQQNIVAHLSQISNRQLLERSKFADCIAAADEYLRFIDGHPVGNPVGQCIHYNFCVVNEPIRRIRIQPAAFLVQGIRIIPVEQGNHWSNTSFQQSIDQIRIELNAASG